MVAYNSYSDEELLALLKGSDEGAFAEIYNRYTETLYRFAYNILQDENECTDAIQEIFIWLWNNRQRLQITALKYYLLAAVKHKLARAIRNSKRKDEILAAYPIMAQSFTEETLELKELKAIISQFTESLPPKARRIFDLSRNKYLTNREISAQLGISEKTVENHMTITLKKLKETLGSFWMLFL